MEETSNERGTHSSLPGTVEHSLAPVCIVRQRDETLETCSSGIELLDKIKEPIAVICIAGQYRTGKSFFLNQLASKEMGFRVGHTTESCTRGIWIMDTHCRTSNGDRMVLLDTEGMAALDNDESYDAKIFSLGLLLSSLFVFNSIGVIDESAVDRLFLVSELTKHVCSSSSATQLSRESVEEEEELEEQELGKDRAEAELAQFFPPFVWLLRDFVLNMENEEKELTPNEYLESALQIRDGKSSKRVEERNRIRKSLRILFPQRECATLVRPIIDETKLRNASSLDISELRPEFVEQMDAIRTRILSIAQPKNMYGTTLNGPKLVHLVHSYVETLNSGSVPDIKVAWEYVSEATSRAAEQKASDLYDEGILRVVNEVPIAPQSRFEMIHKKLQEAAIGIFKSETVEGPYRTQAFQRLKKHVQSQKTLQFAQLQARSQEFCTKVSEELALELFEQPLGEDSIETIAQFTAKVTEFYERYETQSAGPAKKTVLMIFFTKSLMEYVSKFFSIVQTRYQNEAQRVSEERAEVLAKKEKDLRSMTEEFHALEVEATRVRAELASCSEQLASLSTRHEELRVEKETLVETRNSLEDTKRTLEGSVQDLTSQLHELSSQQSELSVRYEYQTQQLSQLEEEKARVEEEAAAREKELAAALEAERNTWETKLSEIQREMESLGEDKRELMEALSEVQSDLETERDSRSRVEDELLSEKQVSEGLRQELMDRSEHVLEIEKDAQRVALAADEEKCGLEERLDRAYHQLGHLMDEAEIEKVMECVVTQVEASDRMSTMETVKEEKELLQDRLAELFMKVSTLPDFYQRQIFCSEESEPDFFDVLTS